jgi:ABC-type multidrug transport system ATPase subunit
MTDYKVQKVVPEDQEMAQTNPEEGGGELERQVSPPTLQTSKAGTSKQIRALLKKNMKIHMRTNACPCFTCCGPGQAIPCVVFSGCCLHFFCPIIFVFCVTAVPFLIAHAALEENDRKQFLDVQVEKPVYMKAWSGWPKEYFRLSDSVRSVYGMTGGYLPEPEGQETPDPNDPHPNWENRPPVGVRPLLDTLFARPELKRGRWELPNQYSCHCKTLGLVGPSGTVKEFQNFLDAEYNAWKSRRPDSALQTKYTNDQFSSMGNTIITASGVEIMSKDERRLAETNFSHRFVDEFVDSLNLPSTTDMGGLHSKRPEASHNQQTQKRRLQKRRFGGGDSDREIEEPALAWAECNVDSGHESPIWRHFGSEDDVEKWVEDDTYGDYYPQRSATSSIDRLCGVVVFNNDVLTAGEPDYVIRLNVTGHSNMWYEGVDDDLTKTDVVPDTYDASRRSFLYYWNSGFLAIQHLMHTFLATRRNDATGATTLMTGEPHFVPMPLGESTSWVFGDIVATVLALPLTMTLQFGPLVACLAYYIARERLTRQRELMRMMGLSDAALMWSWVLMFVGLNLLLSFFIMCLFMIFMIRHSDWFLFWLMMWWYANSVSVFGMSMAAFVSSDKWSALSALGLFFAGSWTVVAAGQYAATSTQLLLGLLPSNAFIFTANSYFQWEWWQIGTTWGNSSDTVKHYSYGLGLFWMFFDFWLWLAIYYYFDQIVPWHNVGVARKPWFCCLGSYWREFCGKPPLVGEAISASVGNPHTKPEFIEEEDDEHLKRMLANNQSVIVDGLEKHFFNAGGARIKAVDGLSLKMYQDECFCLLGHNGAGKTTTMMMITGCMPQSAGKIKVQGYSIPEQIRVVRSSMGFCPQHNVLFDELTVFEHLELFGQLGGMNAEYIQARGDELLTAVALLDKKYARAASLSGGMKRKLSCALAFLAEPYMVILDEPSSGMDPFARRGMWDTLKRWRSGHIICLTTHYMDEADALGDRIAIMANGRLACSGSSTFLKRTFGCGYVISFAKSTDSNDLDGAILDLVRTVLGPVAEIMSTVGKELLVQVPFASAEQFPALFPAIDSQREQLKIESYGTSVTNLEEVFLKVAKLEQDVKRGNSKDQGLNEELVKGETVIPQASFMKQFYALFLRRIKFGMRDKISFCCNLFIPVFCLLIAVALMSISMVFTLPKLELTVDTWNEGVDGPRNPMSLGWSTGHALAGEIEASWAQRSGMGPFYTSAIEPILYVPQPGSPTYDEWNAKVPGSVVEGLQQEAGFVKYLMDNKDKAEASQYGGIFYPNAMSWCPAQSSWMSATSFNATFSGYWPQPGPTFFSNLSAWHSSPILFNAYGEIGVSQATNGGVRKIKVSNHPLDKTEYERGRIVFVSGILASVMIMAAYGFIPSGATFYVVMEKEKDVYNQLIISGASQVAYWLSNFVFDVLWGFLPAAGAMIIFGAYDLKAFITEPGTSASVALFIIYMPAMAGLAYLVSFLFSKAGNALIFSWIFNLSVGFLGVIILSIVLGIDQTYDFGVFLRWVFRFIPTFSLGYGFLIISIQQPQSKVKGVGPLAGLGVGGTWCTPRDEVDSGTKYREDRDCRYMIGDEFLILALCSVFYIVLVIFLDIVYSSPACKRRLASRNLPPTAATDEKLEDEMVLAEKTRVAGLDPLQQFVYVKDLHKVYPNGMHAVKGISFAASEGQVFGLLGVNGAGKTSTFKMLCGQVEQTSGEVMIQGISVATRAPEARRLIGYCPQFDALLEQCTVDEHLYLYGRIKGLSGKALADAVASQINELDLASYVRSRAGQLSGGNKRKLSVAMATIAEPPMVFLDEPSAGMDPVARRGMWSLIQSIAEKRKKSVVILTTHSMEEAEALCSRIAIQVDGRFRCLGTSQQIKSKYGQGLELNVRLATPTQADLAECCTKLGGAPGTVVQLEEAITRSTTTFGEQVVTALKGRLGSPLNVLPGQKLRGLQLSVLAEWGLLQERTSKFENFLLQELGAETGGKACAVVLEKTQNVVRYQIMPEALLGRFKSLGALFSLFKDNSQALLIEDFQVCQTSLEQVFNKFAASQEAQSAYQQAGAQAQPAAAAGASASDSDANQVTPLTLGKAEEEAEKVTLQICVPEGYSSGQTLRAQNPNTGKTVDVKIPDGLKAGDTFTTQC